MRSLYPIGNEFSSNDIEVPLGGGEQSITAFEVVAAKDTQEEDNKCALLPEPRKRLELLHIPKTGGSALTSLAALSNITWSSCHWKAETVGTSCPPHPKRESEILKTSAWHVPISYVDKEIPQKGLYSPYDSAAVFAVVRDPYSRLVSQWNFIPSNQLQLGRKKTANLLDRNNAKDMNRYLVQKIMAFSKTERGSKKYFMDDAHFLSQHDYFVGQDVIILHYESLASEFPCLMRQYGLDLKIPKRENGSKGKLTTANLTQNTRDLIARVYAKDFEEFGYPV